MKHSIIKSCDILFSTIGGYYQVTKAKDNVPYSPALHTKLKHCFDDIQTPPSLLLTSDITAVNNHMMLSSLKTHHGP